jgi:hypothetical protein
MGDIFDTLMSLSDFGEFKELMLSHKAGPILSGWSALRSVFTF